MSDFEHVFEAPPEGAAADWTIPQNWAAYTDVEHETWNTLYARQMKILPGRACEAYMRGLDALDLNMGGIPDFEVMNPKLQALTAFQVAALNIWTNAVWYGGGDDRPERNPAEYIKQLI